MRFQIAGWLVAVCSLAGLAQGDDATFNRDVLPILQENCQSCHRPGEVAPMSFLTYQETRPWAKAIKSAVVIGKMPPWFADPKYGHFANERRLTREEIRTIAGWADNGAPEGDPADKPAPIEFAQGWTVQPDVTVGMPQPFPVPAEGILELTHFIVPGFKEDTWITSLEIRPSDPSVVHHAVVQFVPHDDSVPYGEPIWRDRARDEFGDQIVRIQKTERSATADVAANVGTNLDGLYLPGGGGFTDYGRFGAAKLVPAGMDIYIGMHYTTNGTATMDQTQVGFTIAKEEPTRRYVSLLAMPPQDEQTFHIPAGDPNWKSELEVVMNQDADLVWFSPHMHQRGKSMTFELTYPSGEKETVLDVQGFNFEWQMAYEVEKPVKMPKGTRMKVVSYYDNSANNKWNPNPDKDVWWGDQSWEEMMGAFFSIVVDNEAPRRGLVSYTPR